MRRLLPSICIAVSTLLAACGGGGSGDAPPVVNVNVGGTLAGLGAGKSVVIADASGPNASLSANGNYALSIPQGTAYNLRIQAQPAGQTCTISNGSGTANADVNSISVVCADTVIPPEAKVVSGTVTGLGAGKTVVLQLNASGVIQEITVSADGGFQLPEPVAGAYTLTVKTAPTGQACTVATNGANTVTCAAASSSFKLGGTVSGNIGVVAFRNAANGDTLVLNTNGAFTFAQPVLAGGSYDVAVFDQSAGQTCSVAGGRGVANADVSSIQVSCAAIVAVAPPSLIPAAPTGLTMSYNIKSFNLAWGTVTGPAGGGTVSYRLFEDPDGAGPTASTQLGGTLSTATYTQVVSGLLHTRLNARYTVQACNSMGCSSPTAAVTPNLAQAIGYFKASNTGWGYQFGWRVALSADGSTLAVGSDAESGATGAVYVFTRTGTTWSQQAYVKASNAGANDWFGTSVALSADGSTLAVGAVGEGSAATGVGGNPLDNSQAGAGAVYVFTRVAGTWSEQAYVKASNTRAFHRFGASVALSGDGGTLAVGASQEGSNATGVGGNQADNSVLGAGAVYVFTRAGAAWSQQAYVKASNTDATDRFGFATALSADGDTLVVGAPYEHSTARGVNGDPTNNSAIQAGAAYVFARSGGAWSQQAYLKASNTGVGDQFGSSVALSGDGQTLAVAATSESGGSPGVNGNDADNSASNAGAVYVFTRAGVAWSQQAYVKASNPRANAVFGRSVALSADGNTMATGAYWESSNATGINGNQANNSASASGAAYLFARTGTSWSQQAYVKAGNTGANDWFGNSIALSADATTLAVGALGEASSATGVGGNQTDNSVSLAGAVYIY